MKHSYQQIKQNIKQYWIINADYESDFETYLEAYKKIGLNPRYKILDIPSVSACFWLGKQPVKFIKDFENSINSGNPS